MLAHFLAYSWIGASGEMKNSRERYCPGSIIRQEDPCVSPEEKQQHPQPRLDDGMDLVAGIVFSLYDHALDMSSTPVIFRERFKPARHGFSESDFCFALKGFRNSNQGTCLASSQRDAGVHGELHGRADRFATASRLF